MIYELKKRFCLFLQAAVSVAKASSFQSEKEEMQYCEDAITSSTFRDLLIELTQPIFNRTEELKREGEVLVEAVTEIYYTLAAHPEAHTEVRKAVDRFKFVLNGLSQTYCKEIL